MEGSLGVRKGAWTEEEDTLLKQYIDKYGEGKWHQVPPRAGLNRCRKSCRLRWLNYLKPNIKRGEFKADEVDLMIRLHKLLGNRLRRFHTQVKSCSWQILQHATPFNAEVRRVLSPTRSALCCKS